jgi:hypothetical protein
MKHLSKIGLVLLIIAVAAGTVQAQRKTKKKAAKTTSNKSTAKPAAVTRENTGDTTAPRMVTVTSAFKPFLKNAAKLNFSAATPVIDSSRIPVAYNVPAQNLFYSYQPVAIKPLALAVDSGYEWENHQYIKVGAGNFSSYFGEAGFSFGDGKHNITNLKGNFLTSTGHNFAQQASRWGLDALSIFNSNTGHEWTAHAFYNTQTQYEYGFQPATLSYPKDNLLREYNTVGIDLGMRNKMANAFGITYHPQLSFVRFSDNYEGFNNDLVLKLPVSKSFGKIYSFDLGLTADMSNAEARDSTGNNKYNNNLYYITPAINFKTPNVKLHAGLQPSWDNKNFSMLPDFTVEGRISDAGISLEAGWVGYFQKNTYRTLAAYNPWVTRMIPGIKNTRFKEQYAGIKGTPGDHFTFAGRISLLQIENQPLFLNNIGDGRTFDVAWEPSMKAFRVHGELGYTEQEKFSFLAAATYTNYNSLSVNTKPWGLLPLELTGTLKWKLMKDLQLRADVFAWDGAAYRDKALDARKADPVADLNFGAEFTVIPKLNLWIQMNNLLNSRYQRWNQYEVLGFNVLGGIVYSFK